MFGRAWGEATRLGLASWLVLCSLGCASPPPPPRALSEQNGRSVSLPVRFGWLSSEQASAALPSAIALGGKASGRVLLYFEFAELNQPRDLLRAELLLTTSGAPGGFIDVELSRCEPARELGRWSDQPQPLYPRLS